MNEKTDLTLAELKGEEVRLRDKMESGIDKTTKTAHDWLKAQRKVKELESWLLWTIVSLVLILFIGGCAKIMRGSGLIAEGIGDGVVAAGQHLQESTNQEK